MRPERPFRSAQAVSLPASLLLRQFTQLGNTAIDLSLTGATTLLQTGPASSFGGDFTVVSPRILLNTTSFSGAATLTKTGATGEWSTGGNTFNGTTTINQQGAGYFGFASSFPDIYNGDLYVNNNSTERVIFANTSTGNQFNGNIILTQVGTSVGTAFGWSATSDLTMAAGKTISIGAAGFSAGYLQIMRFTQLGNTPVNLPLTGTTALYFGPTSTIDGNMTATSSNLFFNGCTFNGTVTATKTGAGNDYSSGGNIFQASTTLNNSGSGILILGNGNPDTWNSDVTFNSSGSSYIGVGWNSPGNAFNGNITVSSTGTSVGVYFDQNSASTAVQAAGYSIQTGAAGFSTGTLYMRQFTQLGNTPTSLSLTGTNTLLQTGPSSSFGGDFTAVSPRILLNTTTFSGVTALTKTGAAGEWSFGGNTFNSTTTINQQGGGYFGFANGAPDIYNGDLYVNNNSTERVIFGNSPTGNQFNGNIILTQTGSSVGIAFGWSAATDLTMAAGKTISIGAAGFSTGYLQIMRFTQLGSVPVNLPLTGTSALTFGPTSTIGGDLTSTSASLYFNGCTFNGAVNSTKNGATNDYSAGNNIFNGPAVLTDQGSGFLLMGNGNRDQFMSAATFNNLGTSNIFVAYNSPNNVFGGVTTFNNSPTANTGITVSPYSSGTVFNDNIVATSTAGTGVTFCNSSTSASATLAAGKTISIGAGGFSAGTLLLRQFTQTGPTPQSLTLTGTASLYFGPLANFGGNLTTVSPTLFFNSSTFNGTVTSLKNGTSSDQCPGNNLFNGAFTMTNTGTGYFMMGNGNPDTWQSTAVFNNQSPAQHMYVAYNSTGNVFNGDVSFNNSPGANNLWIYPNAYGISTQYNGNVIVNNVNGGGIYFGNGTGTSVLSSGKTISVGSGGFNSGGLVFRSFTQSGNTAQNITTTGTSYIQYGNSASFDASLTSSSPGLFFQNSTFNGTVNCTKTGSSSDQSYGNNIFNGAATFTNNGTGYLLMTNNAGDFYNNDVNFVQSNTGLVYPNYNNTSNYAGSISVTSPSASAITFGAGNGTAVMTGSGVQNMNATAGTPIPVFARLVVANTGGGVTLNTTSINVSKSLVLTSGLLNTTTARILTMLNGSVTAPGDALSTSYVNGPMRYQKSTSGATTLNFPIGTAPDCRPVVLTVSHSNGTLYTYQAQLFNASAKLLSYSLPPTVDHVSDVHYYTIGRTDAAGANQPNAGLSGNQTIQIFLDTMTG
ncbi:beta strand repeat-containing protein [Puia sp. P3]|uniref:beta strand repeat-containing protein n=1 Tax=Puia sp. P3 TaxID=3423952 RepID=UPI003D66A57D